MKVSDCVSFQDPYRKHSTSAPGIKSDSRTFRAQISDEVTLPCSPENLGKFVLVRKHEDEGLTAGSMMVTPDSRFGLVGGYNLRIKNVNMENKGTYCLLNINIWESTYSIPQIRDIRFIILKKRR
jgi:hypothetical protein